MEATNDETVIDRLASIYDNEFGVGIIEAPATDYRLESDKHAMWALDKLRALELEEERLTQAAQARKDAIDADPLYIEFNEQLDANMVWLADATSGLNKSARFFRELLTAYVERVVQENPQTPKTYKFPNGEISRRKLPDRLEIDPADHAAFVTWALAAGRLDLLKITPNLSATKTAIVFVTDKQRDVILSDDQDRSMTESVELVGTLNGWDDNTLVALFIDVDSKGKPVTPGASSHVYSITGEQVPAVRFVVGEERIADPVTR